MTGSTSATSELLAKRRERLVIASQSAPIFRSMGLTLSYDGSGRAHCTMPYHSGFNHALGGIHGGAIAVLLDNAGWFTLAPHYDYWIATAEFQVRLLSPAAEVGLDAVGQLVRIGKRFATATMEVHDAASGNLIALGSGSFVVTSARAMFDEQ